MTNMNDPQDKRIEKLALAREMQEAAEAALALMESLGNVLDVLNQDGEVAPMVHRWRRSKQEVELLLGETKAYRRQCRQAFDEVVEAAELAA